MNAVPELLADTAVLERLKDGNIHKCVSFPVPVIGLL